MEYFKVLDQYVLRTPLLPTEVLQKTLAAENSMDLHAALISSFSNPLVKIALAISSTAAFNELFPDTGNAPPLLKAKLAQTLIKYLIRMTTRATPFGVMGGITVGKFAPTTNMCLAENEKFNIVVLPDMGFLEQCIQQTIINSQEINDVLYFSNPTTHNLHHKIRYLDYRYSFLDRKRSYEISSVDNSFYLTKILKESRKGLRKDELINLLVAEEIPEQDAREFITDLIKNKLLLNEFELTPSPRIYFDKLIQFTGSHLHIAPVAELNQLLEGVKHLNSRLSIDELTSLIEKMNLNFPSKHQAVLQANLFKPAKRNTITDKVKNSLVEAIDVMQYFYRERPNEEMDNFKKAFFEKYENTFVPLSEVLDPEIGINFPHNHTINSYEDDLALQPSPSIGSLTFRYEYTKIDTFLSELYTDAIREKKSLVDLKETNFRDSLTQPSGVAGSFYAVTEIYSQSSVHADNGDYDILVKSFTGPSAAKVVSRFNDNKEVAKMTKAIIDLEDSHLSGPIIYAELVHLPQGRAANIISYSNFRKYEIPFAIPVNTSDKRYVLITDLMLGLQKNKFVLFSPRHNKVIIPRVTNTFNTSLDTVPAYKFLHALEKQQPTNFKWDWGMLEFSRFLPRITYGNIILSKARWNFKITTDITLDEFSQLLSNYRRDFQLPQLITISENDLTLKIDLGNKELVNILYSIARKHSQFGLEEQYHPEKNHLVTANKKTYHNEFIFALVKEQRQTAVVPSKKIKIPQRKYPIGSEWLYLKIYCGIKTSDACLMELSKICSKLQSNDIILTWFFIRFQDPDYHIRLRLKCKKRIYSKNLHQILPFLNKMLAEKKIIDFSINTYEREIEKYAPFEIDTCERFFSFDSLYSLQILETVQFQYQKSIHWITVMKSIDQFLEDFGFNLTDRLNFTTYLSLSYLQEFKVQSDIPFLKSINRKYSDNKALILQIMGRTPEFKSLYDLLDQRSFDVAKIVVELRHQINDKEIFLQSLSKLLHMHFFRMFNSKPRFKEMIIYRMLKIYYTTKLKIEDNYAKQSQ